MTEEKELSIPLPIKIAFIIITLLFFLTLLGFSFVIHDVRTVSDKNTELSVKNEILNKENKKRISEIQANRVASCQEIYAGIRKVFKPFFPLPKDRTQQQLDDLEKFNTTINGLIQTCKSTVNGSTNAG